jgi:exosortase
MTQPLTATARSHRWLPLAVYGGPILALLWAFWTTLAEVAQRWSSDASYSHGYLVPFFALALLWLRREQMPAELLRPNWVAGALLLAAGIGLRLYGAYLHYIWYDQIAFVPCLAGICLLVGGWSVFRWAWPAIVFLAFMIPLPWRVAGAMAEPLQRFATVVSTYLLQSLGLPALAEGNVILLSEVEMGIIEACSGLRMLVVFFALSTAFAMIVKRPWFEKAIVIASAVPIALACNVIRITATGVLHEAVSAGGILHNVATHDLPNTVFHAVAGWLMPPMGLGMLWLELRLLNLLWQESTPASDPVQYTRVATSPSAAPALSRSRRPWQPARSSRASLPLGPRPGGKP